MKLVHIHLMGWTATFRLPLLYSGTGLTSPLPAYSTLLGLIGSVAGREILPHETRIGFVFHSDGTSIDLETAQRLKVDKKSGRLSEQKEMGVIKRQFHIRPSLDLYLDNLSLRFPFESLVNIPCLGRSQDVIWIDLIEEVAAESREEGIVRGTLVPFPEPMAAGMIVLLPDYFDNSALGFTREIGCLGKYQTVKFDSPARILRGGLYHVQGYPEDHVIYLHTLGQGSAS